MYWSERVKQREHEWNLEEKRQDHEWQIQEANERTARELEEERAFNEEVLFAKQEEARKLSERAANCLCVDADGEKILGSYGGDLENGIPQGRGTLLYDDGDVYEGYFLGGKFHGKGVSTRNDGNIRYDGEWRNGKFHGEGTYYYSKGDSQNRAQYKGSFFNGMRVGKGVLTWKDGTLYEGDFAENMMSGRGVMKWPCGDVYEGEFANGTRDGYGKYTSADGYCYEGQWKEGKREGEGKTTYPDGWSAECMWRNDTPYTGETRQYADDGKTLLYEGGIIEGEKQGYGVIYCARNGRECIFKGVTCNGSWQTGSLYYLNGNIWYEGDWMGASFYGKGVEYDEDGNILRQGTFENDELHGEDCTLNHYVDGKLYASKRGLFANGVITKGVCLEGEYRAEGTFDKNGVFKKGKLYQNDRLLLSGDMTRGELFFHQHNKRYVCVKVATQKATYLCKRESDALLLLILQEPESGFLHVYEHRQCSIEGDLAVWSDESHCEKYALNGSYYLTTQSSDGYGELHFDATTFTQSQNQYSLPHSNLHHLILRGYFVDNKPIGECQLSDNAYTLIIKETAMYVDGIKEGEFTWDIVDGNGGQMTVQGTYHQGKMKRFATIYYPDGTVYKGYINTKGERCGLGILSAYQEHKELAFRICGLWDNSVCIREMSSIEYSLRKVLSRNGFADAASSKIN